MKWAGEIINECLNPGQHLFESLPSKNHFRPIKTTTKTVSSPVMSLLQSTSRSWICSLTLLPFLLALFVQLLGHTGHFTAKLHLYLLFGMNPILHPACVLMTCIVYCILFVFSCTVLYYIIYGMLHCTVL